MVYGHLLVVVGYRHLNELGRRSNVLGQISPCRSIDVEILQLIVYTGVSCKEAYKAFIRTTKREQVLSDVLHDLIAS